MAVFFAYLAWEFSNIENFQAILMSPGEDHLTQIEFNDNRSETSVAKCFSNRMLQEPTSNSLQCEQASLPLPPAQSESE